MGMAVSLAIPLLRLTICIISPKFCWKRSAPFGIGSRRRSSQLLMGPAGRYLHHTEVGLSFSCRMIIDHKTFPMHAPKVFHQSSNKITRQGLMLRFRLTKECSFWVCIIPSNRISAAFLVSIILCYQPPSLILTSARFISNAVGIFTDTRLLLPLSFIQSSFIASFVHLKNFLETYCPDFRPSTRKWLICFEFRRRDPHNGAHVAVGLYHCIIKCNLNSCVWRS